MTKCSNRGSMKEYIKSLILGFLIITSVIMTYYNFYTKPSLNKVIYENEEKDLIKIIRPQNYIFSFGDLFIKLNLDKINNLNIKNQYDKMIKEFYSGDMTIKETDFKNWNEKIKKRSFRVKYSFNIPMRSFIKIYGMNRKIEDIYFNEMLFILDNENSVYLSDGNNYYILYSNKKYALRKLYEAVVAMDTSMYRQKLLDDRYALVEIGLRNYDIEKPNNILTPISKNNEYPVYQTIKEVEYTDRDALDLYAKSIFSDDLSYIKKTVYPDSIIYMYGYGKRIFKINENGTIEYFVTPESSSKNIPINFIKGMNNALFHIEKMGITSDSIYLSHYEVEDNKSYFYFNYTKNGYPLYIKGMKYGNMISAEFLGDELVKIVKNIRIVTNVDLEEVYYRNDFSNILLKNRIKFELEYKKDRPFEKVDSTDIYKMCLQEMTYLDITYFSKENKLIPALNIMIADTNYIISLIDGKILDLNKMK